MQNELAVIESKSLVDMLQLPELTDDLFYDKKNQEIIISKIALTQNLVYSPDEEDKMESDSTAMNKFATTLDKTAAAIFKRCTESAAANRGITKSQVAAIQENRQRARSQFAEAKKARLQAIKETLVDALNEAYRDRGVDDNFRKGVLPDPKESMLTPKGALTSATKKIIDQIVSDDYAWQMTIQGRIISVELACRRAGIEIPFDVETIGSALYDKNNEMFQARLDRLIELQIIQKQEMEAKIIRDQEAQKQLEIADALRLQQSEADEIARSKAWNQINVDGDNVTINGVLQPKTDPVKTVCKYVKSDYNLGIKKAVFDDLQDNPDKSKTLTAGKISVIATFEIDIQRPISEEMFVKFFKDTLPEKLQKNLVLVETSNV